MKGYEIFLRKFIPPRVYKEALDTRLGEGWYDWEPETIVQEIRRIWAVDPIEEVVEKIMALQAFVDTDTFWDDPIAFENIILAFNDRHVDPDLIQACNPDELAYGVTVANEIRKKEDFVLDIIEYIRGCHIRHGQLLYHPVLAFAQPEYKDEFRKRVAMRAIESAKRVGSAAPVNLLDPIDVQRAKFLDTDAYVKERLLKGEAA